MTRLRTCVRRVAPLAAALWLAAGSAGSARAAEPDRVWVGGSLLAGSTLLDARFEDFQWDVRPRAAWGAEARAGHGPWSAGVRAWRATSTQSIGQPGAESADVAVTTLELVGGRRLAQRLGVTVLADASVGGLWLGYRPDHVTITPSGGTPIVVELRPVHEWTAGGGLTLSRPWVGPWSASLSVDYQTFSLSTAHRNGNEIETKRESFGDWSARLGLSWTSWRP